MLADDHRVVRSGLRLLLQGEPGMHVVGEAGDVPSALKIVEARKPDVLVLDLNMPGQRSLPAIAAGSKYIGKGTQISSSGLKPGRTKIRLEARDRFGRKSSAKVTIKLRGVRPSFTRLVAPASLKPSARTVRLTVASSLPSTLRSGSGRYAVGSKPHSVTLKVKPGSGDLSLKLVLTAYGKSTTEKLVIKR